MGLEVGTGELEGNFGMTGWTGGEMSVGGDATGAIGL